MLESLLSFQEINKKPWLVFVWSIIICSVATLISLQLSQRMMVSGIMFNLTGLFVVIFTLVPSIYFMTLMIKREELIEEGFIRKHYSRGFWERHRKDIVIFLLYFAGVTLAFAVWSMVLPQDTFQVQVAKINQLHGITGGATQYADFTRYLGNNLQVMFFAFIFSLLFGAGAVFIIVWNASVLGVYIGQLSKTLWEIPIVSLWFLPHGIPEIAGYVAAGLAGGLLSAAIIRKVEWRIIRGVTVDSFKVLILAILLIIVGAGIEAYL